MYFRDNGVQLKKTAIVVHELINTTKDDYADAVTWKISIQDKMKELYLNGVMSFSSLE